MLLTVRAETKPNISLVLLVPFKEHHHKSDQKKKKKVKRSKQVQPNVFFELSKCHKVVKAPLQIRFMTSETQAAQPEKGNKSHFLSLLITPSTIARLTTWQACLTAGISFLIWEAGAPKKKKTTRRMNCHTMSTWERAIWPARFQYLTLQWQLDPIMAEHFSEPISQSSNQTDTPRQNHQT